MASVANFSGWQVLAAVWLAAAQTGQYFILHSNHALLTGVEWAAFTFGIVQVSLLFTYRAEQERYRQRLEQLWVRIEDMPNSVFSRFASRLVYWNARPFMYQFQ
jgi:hypothetical protein